MKKLKVKTKKRIMLLIGILQITTTIVNFIIIHYIRKHLSVNEFIIASNTIILTVTSIIVISGVIIEFVKSNKQNKKSEIKKNNNNKQKNGGKKMNTKKNLVAILLSLLQGVIIWAMLNCSICMRKNIPMDVNQVTAWVILVISGWILFSAKSYNNDGPRALILVPMISLIIGCSIAALLTIIFEPEMIYFGLIPGIVTGTFINIGMFFVTANDWIINPEARNWKKIRKVSDIKNPSPFEVQAINAAQWYHNHHPEITEKDILDLIRRMINYDRTGYFIHGIRFYDYPEKSIIEEYKKTTQKNE